MKLSFRKTDKEQSTFVNISLLICGLALVLTIWYLFHTFGQAVDVTSINYENVVQAHIMGFKLKVAAGLVALGTLVSYGMTHTIAHSPLGRWMFQPDDTGDDSNSKAAKIIALGVVFGGSLIGIFSIIASILGK